jgi:hypothetical protein
MAVGYDFLTDAGSWRPKAHVIAAFAARPSDARPGDFLELGLQEIFAHLKYYLEAQGHLALQVSQFILNETTVSEDRLKKEPLLERWLEKAYQWCLSETPDLSGRVKLREKINSLSSGAGRYSAEVRWHKLAPIVWPLVDFGLVETRTEVSGRKSRCFLPTVNGTRKPLAALFERLSSFDAIEREDTNGTLVQAISFAYGIELSPPEDWQLSMLVIEAYRNVRMPATDMGSLPAIFDLCSVRGAVDWKVWVPAGQVLARLRQLQQKFPGGVRFHYDRAGHESAVVMTETVQKHLAEAASCTPEKK